MRRRIIIKRRIRKMRKDIKRIIRRMDVEKVDGDIEKVNEDMEKEDGDMEKDDRDIEKEDGAPYGGG